MGQVYVKDKLAIVTDGCSDIGPEEARARSLCVIPTQIILGDATLTDSDRYTAKDFWDSILRDVDVLPKTAMVTPKMFLDCFQQAAELGATHILAIIMSSGLSGGYNSACQAAQESPVPTTVIDSLTVTRGIAIQVLAAADARDAGLSFDEIVQHTRVVRDSMRLEFLVDNLEYLVRGGRAGKSAQLLATALNIKPVLRVFEDGHIDACKKCRGNKRALEAMAHNVVGHASGADWHYSMAITSDPSLEAPTKAALEEAGFKAHYDGPFQVGIIVGIYCGPGTVGVLAYRLPALP